MSYLPEHLRHLAYERPVLSGGFVELINCMGDDAMVAHAARISFGEDAANFSDFSNRHLLRYLMREYHTSPFEMCEIVLRIRMPMDIHRQQVRHRTASINEYSTRYKPALDSREVTDAEAWRKQSTDNKQGSSGFVGEWPEGFAQVGDLTPGAYLTDREKELHEIATEVYQERLAFGVAREQARKDLPLSTHTEYIWKMDLHNILHYLRLRMHPHAQQEIRAYAEVIGQIVKECFPWTWEAFEDYRLGVIEINRMEQVAIRALLRGESEEVALDATGLKGRERLDLQRKIQALR
jgi:thymidylate synthase (FAD)